LLCIGISDYAQQSLSSPAASALAVLRCFQELAVRQDVPLPLRSARLVVAPSATEVELVRQLRPTDAALFAAARDPLRRVDLDRILNEWFTQVRVCRDDVAVFYFSGHGLGEDERPGEESKTLLLATDHEDEFRRPPKGVAIQHLLSALQPASNADPVARSQLYLFDCCRTREWRGPPAEQGELIIPVADRLRADPRARDDRHLAVHYACCAGDAAWSSSSDLSAKRLAVTNYADALVSSLKALQRLPELRVHQLIKRIEVMLEQTYAQPSRRGRSDDFPLRVSSAQTEGYPERARIAHGTHADSRAPTELASVTNATDPILSLGLHARGPSTGAAASAALLGPRPGWHTRAAGGLAIGSALVGVVYLIARLHAPPVPVAAARVPIGPLRPTVDAPPGMVLVSAGRFQPGSSELEAERAYADCISYARGLGFAPPAMPNALPCSKPFAASQFIRETWLWAAARDVAGFYLDRTEVTNRDFAAWLEEIKGQLVLNDAPAQGLPWVAFPHGPPFASFELPALARRRGRVALIASKFTTENGDATLPVAFVSWLGASEYCKAHGARLPTELEWEFAARGAARRQRAWANDETPACALVTFARGRNQECAALGEGPTPVATARLDVTPEGAADLGGNVSEWTATEFAAPPDSDPECSPGGEPCRAVRGAGFVDDRLLVRAAFRGRLRENSLLGNVGFRCAKDLP
jgi:serine/threonine-protein kinase